MDEWTSDSLCCEDAKRILQGKFAINQCIMYSLLDLENRACGSNLMECQ